MTSGVIDKTMLVFGQMNEPPGARMRVALTGLTMAEYFRDERGQDVLLFIDNIFRFVQAGSEVSALLGRMPSQVGYQPTLESEMGQLQERSRRPARARSRPCRPSTCPRTTSPTRLRLGVRPPQRDHRALARHRREGHLPGRGPVDSTSTILKPDIVGEDHYTVANEVKNVLSALPRAAGHHRHPRHRRALGRGPRAGAARRKIERFLSQPFHVAEQFTAPPGAYVSIADTVRSFREILEGQHDDLPESAFLLKGTIEDVVEAAKR